MKTAGYDIALLINEGLLNQISGALFYSGFLVTHGSVDFYNGKISVRNNIKNFYETVSTKIKEKVPAEMHRYLKIGFRLKPTREPSIDFIDNNRIRIGTALRIYLFLWETLEVKFDAFLSVACGISMDNCIVKADFANCDIEEFVIKYNGGINQETSFSLNEILTEAIRLYYEGKVVSFELQLPSLEQHIPGIDVDENKPEDKFNIFIKSVKPVSPTTVVVAANVYEDHNFGDSTRLYEFAKNCSLGVAISETAMHKVFNYYWERLKDKSFCIDGCIKFDKLNDYFTDVNEIYNLLEKLASKALTAGFIETQTILKDIRFYYELNVNFRNQPKFDLIGGNILKIYNMAFDFAAVITAYFTVEGKVIFDNSSFIPDWLTPWKDDTVIGKLSMPMDIFFGALKLENLKLKEGIGRVLFDEERKVFVGKVEKIDLYWDNESKGLFDLLPKNMANRIFNHFEKKIVENIDPFVLSPRIKFDVPIIPWKVCLTGKKLEITNSEAIVGADVYFDELKADMYPVPKYVANINNAEVHKIGCDSVMDTYEVHQRGYHLLNDAVNAGFDGCKNCLPVYHSK